MVSAEIWLEVLSWTKALFEATTLGVDIYDSYKKNRADKETVQEASRVSKAFASTYSDEEVDALLKRLQGCRDRFIEQGGGKERSKCICSVLKEASEGNGGKLPAIDDWKRIYNTLKCNVSK